MTTEIAAPTRLAQSPGPPLNRIAYPALGPVAVDSTETTLDGPGTPSKARATIVPAGAAMPPSVIVPPTVVGGAVALTDGQYGPPAVTAGAVAVGSTGTGVAVGCATIGARVATTSVGEGVGVGLGVGLAVGVLAGVAVRVGDDVTVASTVSTAAGNSDVSPLPPVVASRIPAPPKSSPTMPIIAKLYAWRAGVANRRRMRAIH